jgi:hypothetical protein
MTGRHAVSNLSVRLLLVVALAIVPALAFVGYTVMGQRRDAIAQAHENALMLGRSIAFEHERWLDVVRDDLMNMSGLPLIHESGGDACSRYLQVLVAVGHVYTSSHVVDRNGVFVCSSSTVAGEDSAAGWPWFQRALTASDVAVGDYELDAAGNGAITVAYPIVGSATQEVTRVLALAVGLDWINERAAQADLPPDSTLTLVDSNRTVLSRYPDAENWVCEATADVPAVQEVLRQETEGTITGLPGSDENARLYSFVPFGPPSEVPPFRVIVGIPESEAFGSVGGTRC